jgi:cation transport ATPase
MKKITTLPILSLFLISLIAASCGSNRHFGSRKYTPGNYISHKHKAGKPHTHETVQEEPAIVGNHHKPSNTEKAPEIKPALVPLDETTIADNNTSRSMAPTTQKKESALSKAKKQAAILNETYAIKRYIANKQDRKCLAYADEDRSLDPTALTSFILSVVAVAVNVIAIAVIVATSQYIFTLLFIVGMVLGIIGLVFGTQGLRNHRKKGGSTADLVFSILGTALGGAAILTAFVFAFYTLIFFISGL